jgi:hypothetical protein
VAPRGKRLADLEGAGLIESKQGRAGSFVGCRASATGTSTSPATCARGLSRDLTGADLRGLDLADLDLGGVLLNERGDAGAGWRLWLA